MSACRVPNALLDLCLAERLLCLKSEQKTFLDPDRDAETGAEETANSGIVVIR